MRISEGLSGMPLCIALAGRLRDLGLDCDLRVDSRDANRVAENLVFYLGQKYGTSVIPDVNSIYFVTRNLREEGVRRPMVEMCVALWVGEKIEIPIKVKVRDFGELGGRLRDKLDSLIGPLLESKSAGKSKVVDED